MTRPAEPYQPGNLVALRHGANSERVIESKAKQVHAELVTVAPWLDEPYMAPALARYLRACAREELAHDGLLKAAGAKGADKIPTRLLEAATAAARLAAALASDLGLSPTGHARLRAIAGTAQVTEAELHELLERGAETRRRRDAASIVAESVDD